MPAATLPATTRAGTPCAASWNKKWVAEVNRREAGIGRRICGARTAGHTPCLLPSDHESGRCRHHGGFPLTGAPEGNRNAAIHHLYSRRLMICGAHCPAWKSCPFGGGSTPLSSDADQVEPEETELGTHVGGSGNGFDSVDAAQPEQELRGMGGSPMRPEDESAPFEADVTVPNAHGRAAHATKDMTYAQRIMRLPESERPLCPIEQSEYNGVVTDVQLRSSARNGNAMGRHVAHHVALLTVLVSRASRALAMKPLTEKVEQSGDNFYMATDKPAAGLVALEKLSRELRMWLRFIENGSGIDSPNPDARREHAYRVQRDTSQDPVEANDYEPKDTPAAPAAPAAPANGRHTSDEIDYADEETSGFDEGAWTLIGQQNTIIANLYDRLRKAAERGFVDEADNAPDASPTPLGRNGAPAP